MQLFATYRSRATRNLWAAAELGLTLDLVPAWAWKFWRVKAVAMAGYKKEVSALRAWSARYTGSKTWRTRAARIARRELWGATCAQREQMWAAA